MRNIWENNCSQTVLCPYILKLYPPLTPCHRLHALVVSIHEDIRTSEGQKKKKKRKMTENNSECHI